ncbi:MAG: ABC transporter permease [Ectothiorhodospiraceae bacterium]|nr:ABC transporter permease [Ectothiorhodospiraceae bacterium]
MSGHDAGRQVTVIEPEAGWRWPDLRSLWTHRELLWVLAARDVRVRYKQTLAGVGWAVLTPLAMLAVFSLVFGRVARLPSDGLPYPLFAFAGLVPWLLFSATLSAAAGSLLRAEQLVTKVWFPRLVIPVAAAGPAVVDLGIAMTLLAGLALAHGVVPGPGLVVVPILLLTVAVLGVGIGAGLAAMTALYRDVAHAFPFLVQLWMLATPVVYPASMFPPEWRPVLWLNPVAGLVEATRGALLGRAVDGTGLAVSLAVGLTLAALGLVAFTRLERRVADVV